MLAMRPGGAWKQGKTSRPSNELDDLRQEKRAATEHAQRMKQNFLDRSLQCLEPRVQQNPSLLTAFTEAVASAEKISAEAEADLRRVIRRLQVAEAAAVEQSVAAGAVGEESVGSGERGSGEEHDDDREDERTFGAGAEGVEEQGGKIDDNDDDLVSVPDDEIMEPMDTTAAVDPAAVHAGTEDAVFNAEN